MLTSFQLLKNFESFAIILMNDEESLTEFSSTFPDHNKNVREKVCFVFIRQNMIGGILG